MPEAPSSPEGPASPRAATLRLGTPALRPARVLLRGPSGKLSHSARSPLQASTRRKQAARGTTPDKALSARDAEHDALALGFPHRLLEACYVRCHSDVLPLALAPECMWVATLTLLHAVYAKAWGLGDEGFCALLTLVRALGGGGTEEAYVCGGREGREYIWVHEEAFGAKRRRLSGPVNHEPASGEGADEKAEAPKGQARKRLPVVMRGLSRAESIADVWSSSDGDGSAGDTASEPTLEQEEEEEEEEEESFEAIDEEGEDEEDEMVDDVMRLASTGQTDEGEGEGAPEGAGAEAMGRFDTRQLRHATQRLLQGGALPTIVPSSEQGQVRPRLQCLVLGVRAFLEAKPVPQLLRRHPRGRRTWRLAVVLEHLVPSRFRGLVRPTRGHRSLCLTMRFRATHATCFPWLGIVLAKL